MSKLRPLYKVKLVKVHPSKVKDGDLVLLMPGEGDKYMEHPLLFVNEGEVEQLKERFTCGYSIKASAGLILNWVLAGLEEHLKTKRRKR